MGSRAARRKSQRRLRRRPGTASQRRGWRAQLPQRRTCSRDPLGEKSRGLAQDQVLVLEPLHLALEAQHLGFIRLLGQGLGRARRKLLIAPLAELARADIQLRRNVSQRPPALHHTLNRLGLVLARKPSPRSFVCHSILLGCLGSLQNPPLHRGKPILLVSCPSRPTCAGSGECWRALPRIGSLDRGSRDSWLASRLASLPESANVFYGT